MEAAVLGTSVPAAERGTASGIINTAAQLGTALGIAALLLVAALTTGIPEPGSPVSAIAWGTAALISCTGAHSELEERAPSSRSQVMTFSCWVLRPLAASSGVPCA